jgi:uncharacterized membrane protein YkvA (DUF1232 family)
MNNVFFNTAVNKASGLFGRYSRMMLLVSQLAVKLGRVNKQDLSFQAAQGKINTLVRLVRSYTSGQYRAIPWKTMATILGAFVYFLNPFDLIPDVAPVIGLTDDFSILVWVYSSVQTEIDKFLTWEQSKLTLI